MFEWTLVESFPEDILGEPILLGQMHATGWTVYTGIATRSLADRSVMQRKLFGDVYWMPIPPPPASAL